MTTAGWVQGAPWGCQAKRRTGDDHGPRDFANFRRWFCRSFLPHIPAAALMVMDHAPYQNVDVDGVFSPTTAPTQGALQRWLQHHPPTRYQEAMMKAARLAVCRQLCPKPADAWDRLAEAAGPHIFRTPQYPPALQPIAHCWAVVKNPCAAQGASTMAGRRGHLAEGFATVTPATCQAAIAAMREEEDRYWQEDMEEPEE
jgi:hypothetical protein